MMNETIEALKKAEKASATAIELIIRQQAKIEELKAKDEKLNTYLDVIEYATDKIKAEAYKECIEKVKSELKNIANFDFHGTLYYMVGKDFFDNFLKEMVGD